MRAADCEGAGQKPAPVVWSEPPPRPELEAAEAVRVTPASSSFPYLHREGQRRGEEHLEIRGISRQYLCLTSTLAPEPWRCERQLAPGATLSLPPSPVRTGRRTGPRLPWFSHPKLQPFFWASSLGHPSWTDLFSSWMQSPCCRLVEVIFQGNGRCFIDQKCGKRGLTACL